MFKVGVLVGIMYLMFNLDRCFEQYRILSHK